MAAIPSLASHYDDEADLIAVWWERPAKIVCVEAVPGVFLHVNPHTDEVVAALTREDLIRICEKRIRKNFCKAA